MTSANETFWDQLGMPEGLAYEEITQSFENFIATVSEKFKSLTTEQKESLVRNLSKTGEWSIHDSLSEAWKIGEYDEDENRFG